MIPTTPGRRHAVEHRAAERRDLHRLGAERAVADDVARALLANVEQRQALTLIPARAQHQRDRPGVRARRLDRRRRRGPIEHREPLGGGKCRPFRRPHPRHPAAFLIDQDRQVVAAAELAQAVGQPQQLLRVGAIAPEQDEAGGLGVAEESALVGGQLKALRGRRSRPASAIARRSSFRRPPSASGTPASHRQPTPRPRAGECRRGRARSSCSARRRSGSAPTARSRRARPGPGWRRRRAGRRCRCRQPALAAGSGVGLGDRRLRPSGRRLGSALRPASRRALSGSLLMSSCASLSSPALVSNAVWLSPAMSSPPGFGGFTL